MLGTCWGVQSVLVHSSMQSGQCACVADMCRRDGPPGPCGDIVWGWGTVGLWVHGEGQRCQARDRGFCKLVYFFHKGTCLKGIGVNLIILFGFLLSQRLVGLNKVRFVQSTLKVQCRKILQVLF